VGHVEGRIQSGRDPRETFVTVEGARLAVLDWGGDGNEPLVLLHPTGFCAGLFDPLASRLTDRFHPIGIDLPAHGASDAPRDRAGFSFTRYATLVLAVLDSLAVDRCALLGESLGGGVGSLVDAQRPGFVRHLMLCEGIAFDADRIPAIRRIEDPEADNFMAKIARKRRPVWASRDAVRESYGSRPPLDVLAPEALDAYVRWGFVDRADGQVELACSPEDEATQFEVAMEPDGAPAAGRHLSDLSCPATIVGGDASNLPAAWFAAQADAVGRPIVTVEGSHFFLQEDTDRAEALVRDHLG
jgi:pimeloyl-ACP methyl ester carboxylesterase